MSGCKGNDCGFESHGILFGRIINNAWRWGVKVRLNRKKRECYIVCFSGSLVSQVKAITVGSFHTFRIVIKRILYIMYLFNVFL